MRPPTVPATPDPATDLACFSVAGPRVPLALLEALSVERRALEPALPVLRRRCGADQLCLLSTCERVELYAVGLGPDGPTSLLHALSDHGGVRPGVVEAWATLLRGRAAARHLLRVATGLESSVLGEVDVVGQVRDAFAAGTTAGVVGLELERLVATAVHTARRVQHVTHFGEVRRSLASAAVRVADQDLSGLRGRRVLVVGSGDVASRAVETAVLLGAEVTVCCRRSRRAQHFAAQGAAVTSLDQLPRLMAGTAVAVFGTAAPESLITSRQLAPARDGVATPLLVLDLGLPRNVDPAVGALPGVRLLDLADLHRHAPLGSNALAGDVAVAEEVIDQELDRFHRWLARRSAAAAVTRLRAGMEACVERQVLATTRTLPEDVRPLVAESVRRALNQLAHRPTTRLLAAAEAGDTTLVEALASLFEPEGEVDPATDPVAPGHRPG